MKKEPLKLLNNIAQKLFDKKANNIILIDVRDVSSMTDFFLIAEGGVDRHVRALGKLVIEMMREEGEEPIHAEGLQEGDWVVIDYLDIVIHLFVPSLRDKYRMEELWQTGKIVDLEIEISRSSSL
jgi:ribosome-associated protein